MNRFDFHPEALADLDEIWDFIAVDNLDAADRVVEDILAAVRALVPFPAKDISEPILHRGLYVSGLCGSTSSHTPTMKNPCGSWL